MSALKYVAALRWSFARGVVFSRTPRVLRQRRFSRERSVWVANRISAYAGSGAKNAIWTHCLHVRMACARLNTSMMNLLILYRASGEKCAKCRRFLEEGSLVPLLRSARKFGLSRVQSGRPARSELARPSPRAFLRRSAGVHVGRSADFFRLRFRREIRPVLQHGAHLIFY